MNGWHKRLAGLAGILLSGAAAAAVDLSFANGTVATLPDGTQVLTAPNPLPPDPFGLPQVSDGSMGALSIVSDTVLPLPADGVFNLTRLSVAPGARLSFTGAAASAISLLMTEASSVDGIIDAQGFRLLSFYGPEIAFGPSAQILTGPGILGFNVIVRLESFPITQVLLPVLPPIDLVFNAVTEPPTLALAALAGILALRRRHPANT